MFTILHGSTFCVSDALGDVGGGAHGLFLDDTRMLSTCRLTLDGAPLLLLTSATTEYFSAKHYLRNRPTERLPADTVSVARDRFIASGMTEHLVVRNESMQPLAFALDLELGADFADVISVKAHDFAFGDAEHAPPLPPERAGSPADPHTLVIEDGRLRTRICFSRPPEVTARGVRFPLRLEGHESWTLTFAVDCGDGAPADVPSWQQSFGRELAQVRDELVAWTRLVPELTTPVFDLDRSYARSLADLASLRLHDVEGAGALPAAGMPWFMTLFGRDTIITSLQTLLFGPELATGALRALAALQAVEDDPSIDAEPGKILHELRRGRAAETWFPVYYGSLDATPLFLVLLSELWAWTGDDALVLELEEPARRAVEWLDRHADRDGDGFAEYERRTARGLANQSWKDSGDSQRFADGRFAVAPLAPAEVQGYVFDARLRVAQLARDVWGDPALAARQEAAAADLAARFDEAFWVEDGGFYALALDRDKRQVDALCSNMGHLLWSGIVPEHRIDRVVELLTGEQLWSGWGIRTMSTRDAAFNPLSYHNGTVWPHDTILAAWGMARSGRWEQAHHIARCLVDAAGYFDHSLPEVFAGYPRHETAFPVAYPTAARPQAWAAGAPVLALTLLLGLRPDRPARVLRAEAPPSPWLAGTTLTGIRALAGTWTVRVSDSAVQVHRA